jgi:hypothetical protein
LALALGSAWQSQTVRMSWTQLEKAPYHNELMSETVYRLYNVELVVISIAKE